MCRVLYLVPTCKKLYASLSARSSTLFQQRETSSEIQTLGSVARLHDRHMLSHKPPLTVIRQQTRPHVTNDTSSLL